jgi:hypothetical protein
MALRATHKKAVVAKDEQIMVVSTVKGAVNIEHKKLWKAAAQKE